MRQTADKGKQCSSVKGASFAEASAGKQGCCPLEAAGVCEAVAKSKECSSVKDASLAKVAKRKQGCGHAKLAAALQTVLAAVGREARAGQARITECSWKE